jgi:hypothetical protein
MCLVKTRYTLSTESTLATSMETTFEVMIPAVVEEETTAGEDKEEAVVVAAAAIIREVGMHRMDGPLLTTLDVRGRRAAWTRTLSGGASAANASKVALPPLSRLALDWSTYTCHS